MRWFRQVIGGCLMVCMLATACIAEAADAIAPEPVPAASAGAGTGIQPMADRLVMDFPILSTGASWYQEKAYTSYRVWVDNTTKYEMKVTITEPNGNTRVFYVPAGKNKSYPVNGVPSGIYKLSFYTGGNAVSGTVRVRVADMALSYDEDRSWSLPALEVQSVGIARARYTNNRVSEHTGGGQVGTIGGRTTRAAIVNPFDLETNEGNVTLGLDRGEGMTTVIRNVFGHDLSSYSYVSFAELWDESKVTDETQAIRRILIDTCMEIEVGEKMPLGYLYKGNDVYTVVEQPDGSLKLTKYVVQSAMATQSMEEAGVKVLPDYQVVESETNTASQSVINSLYE